MYDEIQISPPQGSNVKVSPVKEKSKIVKLLDSIMDHVVPMIPPNPKNPAEQKPRAAPGAYQGVSMDKKTKYADKIMENK